jgi:transglutaminase-like putative cysteine protease
MPLIYKVITAALALTGCASLVVTGELNPVFTVSGIAMLPGYYRHFKGLGAAPRWAVGGLSIAAIMVLLFEIVIIRGDYFVAVAHMTIAFQAIKSFDLKEPWDPLQVYFMALLQLIISSELGLSMLFGAVFIIFLFTLIAAIVFSHFVKEGTVHKVRFSRPLVFVSLFVFISTVLLFAAVPRVKGGYFVRKHAKGIRSVGFTERVDFGSFGHVLIDPTIVMRAEISGPRLPLYWRGVSLDYFDGVSWKNTVRPGGRVVRRAGKFYVSPGGTGEHTIQKIVAEPIDTNVVFGLGKMHVVESPGHVLNMDRAGSLYHPLKGFRRFSYTAYSLQDDGGTVKEARRYLQFPKGMEKTKGLARELLDEGMSDLAKAKRVEAYLRNNFDYSLDVSPSPPGMTPVEDFLFNSQKGFCEHYATAMVMVLRAEGVPARIVTGFYGGEENSYGDYIIIRQSNAHSWVEAAVDGRWERFDPTPLVFPEEKSMFFLYLDSLRMSWYRYVIGYSSTDQFRLLKKLTAPSISIPSLPWIRLNVRPVYIILAAVMIVLVMLRFSPGQIKFRRRPLSTRLYMKFRSKVIRRGGRVSKYSTPSEVECEAINLLMDGSDVREFIRMYKEARFGEKEIDAGMKDIYQALMRN